MSGYLHNLARRALRREAVLHAVAALPFAAVPSMPPQEEESRVAIRPPARSPDSAGAAPHAKERAASRPVQEEGARIRGVSERTPREMPAPEPLMPLAVEMPQPLARAGPPAAPSGTAPRTVRAATSEPDRRTVVDAPRDSAREDSFRGPEAALPRVATLAQVIAVPSRRAAPMTPAQASRPVRTVETATEVHLSIGRVEVAVLAQSPTPKEARPRARARTMSLAEYERRRRECDR